jgi:hypothetical protein
MSSLELFISCSSTELLPLQHPELRICDEHIRPGMYVIVLCSVNANHEENGLPLGSGTRFLHALVGDVRRKVRSAFGLLRPAADISRLCPVWLRLTVWCSALKTSSQHCLRNDIRRHRCAEPALVWNPFNNIIPNARAASGLDNPLAVPDQVTCSSQSQTPSTRDLH